MIVKPKFNALLGIETEYPVWQALHVIPFCTACRSCAPALSGFVAPVAGVARPSDVPIPVLVGGFPWQLVQPLADASTVPFMCFEASANPLFDPFTCV